MTSAESIHTAIIKKDRRWNYYYWTPGFLEIANRGGIGSKSLRNTPAHVSMFYQLSHTQSRRASINEVAIHPTTSAACASRPNTTKFRRSTDDRAWCESGEHHGFEADTGCRAGKLANIRESAGIVGPTKI